MDFNFLDCRGNWVLAVWEPCTTFTIFCRFETVQKNQIYLKYFYETNKHWQLNLFMEKTGLNGVFGCQ